MRFVPFLYKIARMANDLRHLLRGTIVKRMANKAIGRRVHSRGWWK